MTSFINLMGNDVWTDAMITARTEAMVREHFSKTDEEVINRKLWESMLFKRPLAPADEATVGKFAATTNAAAAAGIAARADMAKLRSALEYEAAERRLTQPEFSGPETVQISGTDGKHHTSPNPALAQDLAERAAAQARIDSATEDTLVLVELRKPPEPAPVEQPLQLGGAHD